MESACKPGSVRLATRQSFLSARRRRLAPATYPGTTRAALSFPYLVLLRVGFTVPRDVDPACGALLPHPFTLTTHIRRCRSAVCSLLHWPSAHAAQELPGTLPCGARTFLDALACDATVRPTPSPSLVGAHAGRDAFRGCGVFGHVEGASPQGPSAAKSTPPPNLPLQAGGGGAKQAASPATAPSVRSLPCSRGRVGVGSLFAPIPTTARRRLG